MSARGCDFTPKRADGPLSRRCANCNQHESEHKKNYHQVTPTPVKKFNPRNPPTSAGMSRGTCPEQKDGFPLVFQANGAVSAADLTQFIRDEKTGILQELQLSGAALLRGASVNSAQDFADAVQGFGLPNYPYLGGAAVRRNIIKDQVYTTNESPPSEPIPFHHEMAQVPNPPAYIFFYCDVPPATGGETPIILSSRVYDFCQKNSPAFCSKMEKLGVRYVRVMPEEDDATSAIGRSWKSTFLCQSREEAEEEMKKLGTTFEWLPNGDLRTITTTVPAIRTDERTGKKTFFNSVVAAFTGWVDSRNDPTKAVVFGDGTAVDAEAIRAIVDFMNKDRVCIPWQKGDILVIDNRVVMHSRNPFTPPRLILASIAHDTEVAITPAESQRVAKTVPAIKLNRTGDMFPQIGLGVWKISRESTAAVVEAAIARGYRQLDCACDYGNEVEVGQGIANALAKGYCKREDLFVVSKLWNTYHAKEHVEPALRKTLTDLGLDYVDLYLIHFPIAQKFVPFDKRYPPEWTYDPEAEEPKIELVPVPAYETWAGMEDLVDKKLARNIGVCNYQSAMLRELMYYARIPPAVLQVERHPYLVQKRLVDLAQSYGLAVTGFSPLGSGSYIELNMATQVDSVLGTPLIASLATKYKRTPAQIVMRWGIDTGCTVIPKTSKIYRLSENIDLFNFSLDPADIDSISALDKHRRFNDPAAFANIPIYD